MVSSFRLSLKVIICIYHYVHTENIINNYMTPSRTSLCLLDNLNDLLDAIIFNVKRPKATTRSNAKYQFADRRIV